jgi:NDP-sugar pyrophosphorylase family protein
LRAVVVCGRLYPESPWEGVSAGGRLPLLVDRPFLQHVVEYIIDLGSNEIDIVLDSGAAVVRGLLGDGSRWGTSIRYHQSCGASIYEAIRMIGIADEEGPILLAHADFLPEISTKGLPEKSTPLFFCCSTEAVDWTGWALLGKVDLMRLSNATCPEQFFSWYCSEPHRGTAAPATMIEGVARPLSIRSYPDIIDAHGRVLRKQHTGLLLTGREIEPNVWISRNVNIHRSTRLIPPVFVGENCRLSSACQIGPAAAIGRDCLVDRQTVVADSVVCPGTYVGEGLKLKQVYIDRNRLVNTRLQAEVRNVDEVLLGSVYGFWRTVGGKGKPWIA